jgi:hypothetical protein
MGCGAMLSLDERGRVSCAAPLCPEPLKLHEIISDDAMCQHIVKFGGDAQGFSITHPLRERGQIMHQCPVHQYVRSLDGPPEEGAGSYRAEKAGPDTWRFVPLFTPAT